MKKYGFIFPIAVIAFLFTSCFDNDSADYPSNIALTTVHVRPDTKPGYTFSLDNGKTIYPADTRRIGSYNAQERDGKRAVIYFNIMEQAVTGYDYNAEMYDISDVLTKQVETAQTQEELDAFGDDPTGIGSAWISGGFLNIDYTVPTNGTGSVTHRFSLVDNKTAIASDEVPEGYIYLEFHHDANGDLSGRLAQNYVSFRLDDYDPSITKMKGICLRVTSLNGFTSYMRIEPLSKEQ